MATRLCPLSLTSPRSPRASLTPTHRTITTSAFVSTGPLPTWQGVLVPGVPERLEIRRLASYSGHSEPQDAYSVFLVVFLHSIRRCGPSLFQRFQFQPCPECAGSRAGDTDAAGRGAAVHHRPDPF